VRATSSAIASRAERSARPLRAIDGDLLPGDEAQRADLSDAALLVGPVDRLLRGQAADGQRIARGTRAAEGEHLAGEVGQQARPRLAFPGRFPQLLGRGDSAVGEHPQDHLVTVIEHRHLRE
jgi:hypothetical protein